MPGRAAGRRVPASMAAMATQSDWLAAEEAGLWGRDCLSFIPNRVLSDPAGTPSTAAGPRLAFCGFPSDYSLAFLFALLRLDVTVAGIVTSPGAHPAILATNALSQVGGHIGAPLLRLWRINDEHARAQIAALDLDGVVMASFDQIVGARTLAIPRHGWLNVHPSALPRYRGPEPVYWTIADGAGEAGITLHRAVPRFDAGPVLAQRLVPVRPDDTAGTLTRSLCEAGAAALGEAVGGLLGDAPGDELDMTAATYRPSVGHRRLDAAATAAEALRMVRAGVPNMPAWAELDGRPAYVCRAEAVDCTSGELVFPDGCVRLLDTRPACGCHHDEEDCPHLQR